MTGFDELPVGLRTALRQLENMTTRLKRERRRVIDLENENRQLKRKLEAKDG